MRRGDRRNTRGRQYFRQNNKSLEEHRVEWEIKHGALRYSDDPESVLELYEKPRLPPPNLNYLTRHVHSPQRKIDAPVLPRAPPMEPLREGSQELVYVSHIVNPHHLYVIKDSIVNQMESLLRVFQTIEHITPVLEQIVPGQHLLAYVSMSWRRSRVISVNVSDEEPMVSVFCMDYGNDANLPLDKLSLMPDDKEMNFSPLAMRCMMYNCHPVFVKWKESDRLFCEKIMLDEQAVMRVRRILTSVPEVDLTTYEDGVNLVQALVYHGRAVMRDPNLEYPEVMCENEKLKINPADIFVNSEEPEVVLITHVLDAQRFYVIKERHVAVYKEFKKDMHLSYLITDYGMVYSPEIGVAYAVDMETACWYPERKWLRCEVVELLKNGWVHVKLPDVGLSDLVRWDALRYLNDDYAVPNAFAAECHLANVTPFREQWCSGSIEFLKQYVGRLMTIKMQPDPVGTGHESRGVSVPVMLYDTSDENNVVCINDEMIGRQFAYTLGYTFYKTPVDEDFDKYLPPQVPAASNSENNDKYPPVLDAIIVNCQTPSRIFLLLLDQKQIYMVLSTMMQHYYLNNNEEESEDKWKAGDKCGALSIQEGLWLRAKILELSNDSAKVAYIDLAFEETVPKSTLKELPSVFSSIGDGVIKCHLYGISPVDGKKWSLTANDYFKELLKKASEAKVCITIMGEAINNSMPIRLWTLPTTHGGASEPDILSLHSLNQKLIVKGLCIPNKPQEADIQKKEFGIGDETGEGDCLKRIMASALTCLD